MINSKQERRSRLDKAFQELHKQLLEEGWYEPSYIHTFLRLFELVLLFVIGFSIALWSGWGLSPEQQVTPLSYLGWLGLFILGIGQARCGWVMHEAGHYSLSGSIFFDQFIQLIVLGCGCGMSASYWRNQHNKHHATPQKLDHDPDLNTLPLVAFNDYVASKLGEKSILRTTWIRMQVPLLCFGSLTGLSSHLHRRFCLPQ
jgi:fatty acid desaturase 2 (delta-6 desaturase)